MTTAKESQSQHRSNVSSQDDTTPSANAIHKEAKSIVENIEALGNSKVQLFQGLKLCDTFISSVTFEAAYGDGIALFGRMRHAAECLPKAFEEVDSKTFLKSEDRRLPPFVRSYLFVALVAELEDFFCECLRIVLNAYPRKLGSKSITVAELLDASNLSDAVSFAVERELRGLFFCSPQEFRRAFQNLMSIPTEDLDCYWPLYVEMKARRDIGVHSGWHRNQTYDQKVTQADLNPSSEGFLAASSEYFSKSIEDASGMVLLIVDRCRTKYGCGPVDTQHD